MTEEIDPKRDELLAIRCQLGEIEAFDELVDRWHGPLWRYVRRLLSSDDGASEVVQDVWLRVLRGIARLRDGSKLRAWLFGIARRTLMDRLREQYALGTEANIDAHDIAAEPTDDTVELDAEELDKALEMLPLVEREVLTLFYLNELSLNDVADALQVPVGTIKSRLFRARRLLRLTMHRKGRSS